MGAEVAEKKTAYVPNFVLASNHRRIPTPSSLGIFLRPERRHHNGPFSAVGPTARAYLDLDHELVREA
jgi:hypothetical protein